MRILNAHVAVVAAPYPKPLRPIPEPIATATAVVVHLEEYSGCVGLGYVPTFGFGTKAVRSLVVDDLVPRLRDVEWEASADAVRALVASAALAGRIAGATKLAISTLECALLDIEAQLAGVALHQLWGEPSAPTPCYASGGWRYLPLPQLVDWARNAVDRGFRAVKLQIGLSPDKDAERVRAVRELVGWGIAVMLDANERIPGGLAVEWLRALEPFEPTWIEEPTPCADHRALVKLRRVVSHPIAAGENETELIELDDLLRIGAVDVIQPDAYRVGLSALHMLRPLAAEAGVGFAPHMAHELSVHATTGSSAIGTWLEYFDWFEDWWDEPVMPLHGELHPPSRAGHGLTLRRGWLAAHTL